MIVMYWICPGSKERNCCAEGNPRVREKMSKAKTTLIICLFSRHTLFVWLLVLLMTKKGSKINGKPRPRKGMGYV